MKNSLLLLLIAAVLIGCGKDDDLPYCGPCTKYTEAPGREPQPWIIENVGCEDETEGTDDQGRYFYIVCPPDYELD